MSKHRHGLSPTNPENTKKPKSIYQNTPPSGTPEEKEEAFQLVSNYLYKLLDYAEKNELIPDDVLEKERRIFSFAMQGPRAGYFRLNTNFKLTSADVIYILTTSLPSSVLAKKYGMHQRKIDQIRRGDVVTWYWEYSLVKRLKTIINYQLRVLDMAPKNTGLRNPIVYSISKVDADTNTSKIIYYTTGKRKAVELRKTLMSTKEFDRLTKKKIIDLLYPIDLVEVLR